MVKAIESSELTVLEEASAELETLIDKAMEQIATDARADGDLEERFKTFHGDLGRRDKAEFEVLFAAYKEERNFRNENLDLVIKLVGKIQKMFSIEE